MRLQAKLVLLFGLLVAVATASSAFLSYAATRDEAVSAVDDFLDRRFVPGPALGSGTTRPTPDDLTRLIDPTRLSGDDGTEESARGHDFVGDDSVFTVLDADGEVVFTSDDTVMLPAPDVAPTSPTLSTVTVDDVRYRLRTEAFGDGTVALSARSLDETDSTLAAVRIRLIVIALLITSLAVIVAWFVAGRLARPLRRLSAAAEHITATGDLSTPLDTGASGEVGQVASSFADMLSAFERSRAQQQRLVVDASHELRTPLTTLRTNVELLSSGRLTAADHERALGLVGAEVDELSNLTAELVELAANQPIDAERAPVELLEVCHAAAARAAARSGRDIVVDGHVATVQGSAAALDRAVSNLLGNAIKFSTSDTPVVVDVQPTSVIVRNTGPTIPDEDLERVFARFYRAPTSRSLPGSGLGLAIVAAIAESHGGRPVARNTSDGVEVGFTFADDGAAAD